jgi:uncharacterized protein YcbK (DUF882 family)
LILSLNAARRALKKYPGRLALLFGAAFSVFAPSMTENAIANGDTRTINLYHAHTQESISATYLVNGQYDRNVLKQLNWFLRDWRRDEPTEMDPRLFDVVWEAYRSAGAGDEVIRVVSAYRSPETNAMLRARSRAVAKFSQHMLGKAMDTTMPGMPMSRVREVGMRMQRGGVGYYPTAGTPFVHLDVGNVRAWPRMTYDQLARLFPDGKTVHIPSNGQPLARYEEAKAEIEARNNGAIVVAPQRSGFGGFLAALFGVGGGEDDVEEAAPPPSPRKQWAELAPRMSRAARRAKIESDEESPPDPAALRGRAAIAKAEADLPRGETALSEAPVETRQTTEETPRPAEYEKIVLVDAPHPPAGRPRSIDRSPSPLEEQRLALIEPAEDSRALRGKSADVMPSNAGDAPAAPAPTPPRRPKDLGSDIDVAALPSAPLPPRRPKSLVAPEFAKAPAPVPRPKHLGAAEPMEAAGALANAVETRGSIEPVSSGSGPALILEKEAAPLAFAPPVMERAKPEPQAASPSAKSAASQRGGFVPARLDRSNFSAMTGETPTSNAVETSVVGPSIAAVRSAAHASAATALSTPTGFAARGFDDAVAAPAVSGFAR